jgi:phage N-6-adenine-methyltransferase
MPRQKPGLSVQSVGTPREFLDAVERRFGPITLDLAATSENKVCELHFGPGTTLRGGEDALDPKVSWAGRSLRFCNPPFGDIEPWAQKCAAERRDAFIALLTPASVGSEWFAAHVHQKALVLALRPRIRFVNHEAGFPRDLLLNVYGPLVAPGFDLWRWRE